MSSAKTAAVAKKTPALILTKPNSGTKAKTSDKLLVDGHEDTVKAMRERQKKIDSLGAQQKKDKTNLTDAMKELRLDHEKRGDFHKTILVDSADGKPGQVIFNDKYSKIDIEHEQALRDGLDGNYDVLMKRGVDVKAKAGVTLAKIKEALGDDAFGKLQAVCGLTEYLSPASDFMTKRASLRPSLSDETNEFIDAVVEQAQYAPSVKLK